MLKLPASADDTDSASPASPPYKLEDINLDGDIDGQKANLSQADIKVMELQVGAVT